MDEKQEKTNLPPYLQDYEERKILAQGRPIEGEIVEENVRGRKPKFNNDYCLQIVEMAAQGKSESHFRAKAGICRTTFYKWQKKHEDFKEAVDMAEDARKAFFHDLLLKGALKAIDVQPVLMAKLFDHHFGAPKSVSESKGPTINVNIDNTGITSAQNKIANLTPEERQEKIEDLQNKIKQQLIEEKGWQESSTESVM